MLILILVIAALGRFGYVTYVETTKPSLAISPDSHSYTGPARSLLDRAEFDQTSTEDVPMFVRTPGYPAFIAAAFGLSGNSVLALLLVQAALGVCVPLGVYLLGRRLFSEGAGLVGALAAAIDPIQIEATGLVLTELVASVVLLLAVAATFQALSRRSSSPAWVWALVGLGFGAAVLVRPTTYYFIVVVIVASVARLRRDGLRALTLGLLAMLVPYCVLVGGWQVRNRVVVGSWQVSAVGARTLYYYRAAGVVAWREGVSLKRAQRELERRIGPEPPHRQGAYYADMRARGLRILREEPLYFVQMTASGAKDVLWSGWALGASDRISGLRQTRIVVQLMVLVGLVAAFVGAISALRRKPDDRIGHVVTLGLMLYVVAVSSGPESYHRFRVPVAPLISLYAGAAVMAAVTWARARTRADTTACTAITADVSN